MLKEIEEKKKEFDSFDHNIRFTFLFLEIYIWMVEGSAFVIGSTSLIWFFWPFVLSTYFVHMHNVYWLVCQKKKKNDIFFRTYPCGSVALSHWLVLSMGRIWFESPISTCCKKKKKRAFERVWCVSCYKKYSSTGSRLMVHRLLSTYMCFTDCNQKISKWIGAF